jgi:hypothetical protein
MKKQLLTAVLALVCASGFSQVKITGVNNFNPAYSNAILNKNNDVDGYYVFYLADKLKKGEREFAIQLYDKNLTEVATKKYVDNKNTFLMKSSFNNSAMMFAMANYKTKEINLLTFDKQANQGSTYNIPLESKEMKYIQMMEASGDFNVLFPVENKGFIFNKVEDNKKIGYSLKFYPTNGGKSWEYNSPDDSKTIMMISPIEVNKDVVVALETSRPGVMSRKLTITTKVLDVNTGKLLFEREYSKKDKPRLITNAFLNNDNSVVLMGEYFKAGDNIMDDKSLGLFTEVIDFTGKTTSENFTTWAEDVAKLMKVKDGSKIKDKGYIYFHDVIKTQTGEFYAIGEFYKKTVSAAGMAGALLGGGTPMTQLTITDAVIFKFNKEFKLTEVKEFAKGKSRAPSVTDGGSPQLNAHALKAMGAFDYVYTQIDKDNDRFYSCFIDYEREKGEKSKRAFKTIVYDEGELTEDKIYLTGDDKQMYFKPAKLGNVLLLEYNKKAKEVSLHLEKLNIR